MQIITDGTAKFAVRDKRMQALVDMFYPVGAIYETTSSTKPEFMNYGTWEQLPGGYTTVSAGTYTETHNVNGTDVTDTYVFTAGKTTFTKNGTGMSGEAEHQITEGELPKMNGAVGQFLRWGTKSNQSGVLSAQNGSSKFPSSASENCYESTINIKLGNNAPHNNIMPIFATYRFVRII